MTTVDASGSGILSVEEMLANAKKAADAKRAGKLGPGASEVEKLLAGRELGDTVELSPVAKALLARQKELPDPSKNYLESDEFLEQKAAYLSAQIGALSNLAGNPAFASMLEAVEAEAVEVINKIATRQKAVAEKAAKAQAELAAKQAKERNAAFSAEDLLKRAKAAAEGRTLTTEIDPAVQKLLDNAKNAVDKTA